MSPLAREAARAPLGQRGRRAIGDLGPRLAAHGHGLEVLGSHHRAHARAARGAIRHVHDRGETHALLARRPGLRDLDLLVAELLADERVHLAGEFAPQVPGGAQFGHAVVDPQVTARPRARARRCRRSPRTEFG
jgi:hypothetical protein